FPTRRSSDLTNPVTGSVGGQQEARSIGKLSGGSNGTAATAGASAAHSATNTETAPPLATGNMRRSHGALSNSTVWSSSNPAARTTVRNQALNICPGGSAGSITVSVR